MYERNAKVWYKHIDFILVDIIAIALSFVLAYCFRFGEYNYTVIKKQYINLAYIMALATLLSGFILRNYNGVLRRGYYRELLKVIEMSLCSLAFTSLMLYAFHVGGSYSRLLVLYSAVIFVIIDYCFRILWKAIVKKFRLFSLRKDVRRILIVSNRSNAGKLIELTKNENEFSNAQIAGLVLINSKAKEFADLPVVASIDNAADFVCHNWIDEILIDSDLKETATKNFENACLEMGSTIHRISVSSKLADERIFIDKFGGQTVLTIAYSNISVFESIFKRFMDILGGIVGCIITLILTIILGPIIYFKSPGQIFFKQKRVGRNGKVFDFYKFRSMCLDAEEKKENLQSENLNTDGMMFKMDFDPRIIGNEILPDGTRKTGIGDFIRRTSLDEFPQFWNVLKGDMSLVGTRPPTLDEWAKYKYNHKARLAVKPGITGLWQVSGRSEITDFEETVKLDTEYIKNFSIGLDIKILLKTVVVLFSKQGAK